MRALTRFVLALLSSTLVAGIAAAQNTTLLVAGRSFLLGGSALVAGGVEEFQWSPDGAALLYVAHTHKGTEIGLYSLKTESGGIAVTLPPEEKLEKTTWLNAEHKAVIVSRRKVSGREVETDLLALRVVSVGKTSCEELWSSEFPAAMGAKVDFELSPTLAHAIVKLSSSANRTFLVLTSGAKSIVPSADLAEAMKRGEDLVGWSSAGTALFPVPTSATPDADRATDAFNAIYSAQRRVPVLSDIPILSRLFSSPPATFFEGEPVLECVPSNGVLRPVRFPGFYEKHEESSYPLALQVVPSDLRLGSSTQAIQALWLIGRGEQSEKTGLLVSSDGEGGSI
jgi:hypothetical protein